MSQQRELLRVNELIEDGYLERGNHPNTVVLTRKGMRVLIATADRPMSKSRLKKVLLAAEREHTQKGLKKIV